PAARASGATSVLVDIAPPESPALRAAFDHVIAGDAHEVLPEWERRANGRAGGSLLDPFRGPGRPRTPGRGSPSAPHRGGRPPRRVGAARPGRGRRPA